MKKLYALCAIVVAALALYAFTPAKDTKGLCRITRINGMEAYILCEPVGDYSLLGDAKTGIKATSLLTGGLVNESISEKVAQFVKKAMKEHPTMDGVVYTAGKNIGAFAWGTKPTGKDKLMAYAQKVDGKYVFICNEPEAAYTTLGTVTGGVKWKSALTGGVVNNSIEEDVSKFMKRALETHRTLDGIIYSSGKSVVAIKFDE